MLHRNSADAFNDAIADGTLSEIRAAPNFAGVFMYMFTTDDGRDAFKHLNTREYVYSHPKRHAGAIVLRNMP